MLSISKAMTTGMLAQARGGRLAGWTVPKDAPDFYLAQMAARQFDDRKKVWVTIGKQGEHLWDCERYALAAAFMAGVSNFRTTQNQEATAQETPNERTQNSNT